MSINGCNGYYGRLVGGREFVMGEGEEAQIKGIEANEKLK